MGVILSFWVSALYMFLIEKCTKVFAWVGIIGTFLLTVAVGAALWIVSYEYKAPDKNELLMKIYAGIVWGIALLFAIVVCCYIRSLKMAIAVIEAAADFVTDTL